MVTNESNNTKSGIPSFYAMLINAFIIPSETALMRWNDDIVEENETNIQRITNVDWPNQTFMLKRWYIYVLYMNLIYSIFI